jgi:hypothetical protein
MYACGNYVLNPKQDKPFKSVIRHCDRKFAFMFRRKSILSILLLMAVLGTATGMPSGTTCCCDEQEQTDCCCAPITQHPCCQEVVVGHGAQAAVVVQEVNIQVDARQAALMVTRRNPAPAGFRLLAYTTRVLSHHPPVPQQAPLRL